MPVYSLGSKSPSFADRASVWIAPDAHVVGDVRIGANVGIWFGAVLRGDTEPMAIGDDTNLQEHAVLHTDPGFPLHVGKGCTIGHRATLHGCTVGDNSLIGMSATVLNGARIGANCLVGAGALVTENKIFEDNCLIVGAPAKAIRLLDADAVARLAQSAAHYVKNARRFMAELRPVP